MVLQMFDIGAFDFGVKLYIYIYIYIYIYKHFGW